MIEGMKWSIELLAGWGLSARTIARKKLQCKCRVKNGTCSHIAAIYRVTRAAGIRMFDYRDGRNDNSALTFKLSVKKKRKAS